jgi:hypothetical protein
VHRVLVEVWWCVCELPACAQRRVCACLRAVLRVLQEIFGPLLPVVSVASVDAACEIIRSKSHPLAMYIFSSKAAVVDRILASTTAGGVTVNDTMLHPTNPHLPFGGVGGCVCPPPPPPSPLPRHHPPCRFRVCSLLDGLMLPPPHRNALRAPLVSGC